ncbi:hypothetical protein [Serratia fonticola]|uniref:hypothetical protein n=1 Tax=Serratia fonticola TaxID=47917 RepID=UPI0024DE0463|nr:hypothetical protein [Serratia fonticola]MDK2375276.1 hypothetical protein [Serratia fonticola]
MKPDYSLRAFVAFLSEDGNDDVNSDATWRNLKNTGLLLSAYVTQEESFGINTVDPDILIERHLKANDTFMSSATKHTYKSRFNSAVGRFIKHQNDLLGLPTNINDVIRNRHLAGFQDVTSRIPVLRNTAAVIRSQGPKSSFPVEIADNQTFNAPILLRPETGLMVQITGIPLDITNEEAERIASFLKLYVRPR